MRAHGYNRVTPVHGYYQPREIRRNGVRIAGWDNVTKSGESVAFDGTYNDKLALDIAGRELLRADWRGVSGSLSQVQTTQGKNLFDVAKNNVLIGYIGSGTKYISALSTQRTVCLRILPSMTYTVSKVAGSRLSLGTTTNFPTFGKAVNQYVSTPTEGNGATALSITTGAADYYLSIYCYNSNIDTISFNDIVKTIQVELGSTATAYAPFVPNSPSPDYPSPITTSIPAGTYKIACPWGGWWEYTLAGDLRGIGSSYKDKCEIDLLSGIGWSKTRIIHYAFTGNETFSVASKLTNTVRLFTQSINIAGMGNNDATAIVGTHFPAAIPTTDTENVCLSGPYPSKLVNIRIAYSRIGCTSASTDAEIITGLKAYLAAQNTAGTPVKVDYAAATETVTPITLTPVTSSNYPELPLSSLNITAASADYPYTRVNAGACNLQISDASAVRQTIALPKIRQVGSVVDRIVFDGTAWWYLPYIGHIASYAGETITTAYSSTTGALTTGSKVDYVLPTPADPVQLALDVPMAYPRHTEISQDGEIKANITATAKVMI